MSITSVNSSVAATSVVVVKPVTTQPDIVGKNEPAIGAVKKADQQQQTGTTVDNQQSSADEFQKMTDELNNFMESMNTDIHFVLHTKTDTLMIQVQDNKTHKVLKECPSHELLDMVAKMRDTIGILLDKKV